MKNLLYVTAFVLGSLPWLNPFAPGSSPAVVPILFSWLCEHAHLVCHGLWGQREHSSFRVWLLLWQQLGLPQASSAARSAGCNTLVNWGQTPDPNLHKA